MKTVNIKCDAELWEKFKKIAKLNDTDASKLLRLYIKDYVSKNSNLFLNLKD